MTDQNQKLMCEMTDLKEMVVLLQKTLIQDRDSVPPSFSQIAGEHMKGLSSLQKTVEQYFEKNNEKMDSLSERLDKVQPIVEIFGHLTWMKSSFVSILMFLAALGAGAVAFFNGVEWLKGWIAAQKI